MLRVELADHPCVLLHEAYTLGDEMLAFGYPIGSTTGDPVTLVSEDWQRDRGASSDQPHLKLKQGQVQPGLSGAPLINLRTGGVCGVVRLTRDRASDLGGRALPTALVLAQYDFLIGLQKAFHSRDRTWISLLGAEQKSVDRNRDAMMKKVRNIWITGFLERSLFQETRILLGLKERPDAVARPLDLLVRRPDQGERPLPPGKQVVDVFDDMDRALLILGAPGSGKTTLLLELARDLLDRATQDSTHPIPVVFPLSTWAESRRPLAEWLVEELNLRYNVHRKIGQEWVKNDQILPLLDGLDEVKPEHRAACVETINAFRQSHGLLPLVICSRTADYQALTVRLRLQGAIVVQPLSPQQVDSYLTEIGPVGEVVREAIRHDPTLWEKLDTPLMLDIVTVAYTGPSESQSRMMGNLKERRDKLFGAYVDQMFRRSVSRRYKQGQTLHWLRWLAREMADHGQTVFYLERLQLDWLPRRRQWSSGLATLWPSGRSGVLRAGRGAGQLAGRGAGRPKAEPLRVGQLAGHRAGHRAGRRTGPRAD